MNLLTVGLQPQSPSPSMKTPGIAIWFGISLITPVYFGLISLIHATTSGPIIQDDARLHVVWLQRLLNPDLFPNDVIADYYLTIQAAGFKFLYGLAATLGLEPLTFAKVLPLGLAVITTIYVFWATLQILPVPLGGVLTTLVLNQNIWLKDDLISATPRAFVYPIFAAFLYYLLRDTIVPCLVALVFLGLFYPQMMIVAAGMLTLRLIQAWVQAKFSYQKITRVFIFWLLAICLTGVTLYTFSSQVAEQVGSLVTAADMLTMPEFQLNGRREYYGVASIKFIFSGASGLRFPLFPPIVWAGIVLPCLGRSKRFSLTTHMTVGIRILPELLLAAVGLFLLAHLIFPTLYLPSRYTFYSTRFVMAIASGLVLTIVLAAAWHWLEQRWQSGGQLSMGEWVKTSLGVMLAIAIITVPAIPPLFLSCHGWIVGRTPRLYQYLAQLPVETLVASVVPETNNIPAFTQRSVLVSEEFAIPYHSDFYRVMTQRMQALVQAQYSRDLTTIQTFIQRSGVDLWIVDQNFATPEYLAQQQWLVNSSVQPTVTDIITQLQQGLSPGLLSLIPPCTVLTEDDLIVLDAHCLLDF